MAVNPTLYCPVRGQLAVKAKTKDGLRFTEEKRRIDCIKFLLSKGYPAAQLQTESILLQFGHKGKNSFRTDVVAYDIPAIEAKKLGIEERRSHILLLAEVKRDNEDAPLAKETQVKPALGFLPNLNTLGVYWDDVEQKVFYREVKGDKQTIVETPITYLPAYGEPVKLTKLRYKDLSSSRNLIGLFHRIEDKLHPHVTDKSLRYPVLLQLLLVKIYDEESHKAGNGEMSIQDFSLFTFSDADVLNQFNATLKASLEVYQSYLPREVPEKFTIPGSAIRNISELLAPVNMMGSGPEVVQDFYMFFAKELYKWDLAQYFTPYEVVDFIVRIANPRYGNTIKDPACGSADFLISAFRRGSPHDSKMGEKIWGADNSPNAVQISVLNMVLNGDGKSNIYNEDSLVSVNDYADKYSIMLCNPPFGVRIKRNAQERLIEIRFGSGLDRTRDGSVVC
jgi:type I restriction enzyme M protein